jgi:hypothetical protein
VELRDLKPHATEAMRRRGLARKANGTPTTKSKRNFSDPDGHLMKSSGHYNRRYNCRWQLIRGGRIVKRRNI